MPYIANWVRARARLRESEAMSGGGVHTTEQRVSTMQRRFMLRFGSSGLRGPLRSAKRSRPRRRCEHASHPMCVCVSDHTPATPPARGRRSVRLCFARARLGSVRRSRASISRSLVCPASRLSAKNTPKFGKSPKGVPACAAARTTAIVPAVLRERRAGCAFDVVVKVLRKGLAECSSCS